MRGVLEEMWGIDALDIYGLSEVIGPGVSMECREAKEGLHIAEDHFLAEVIDPYTGESLPEGETGELVFTSLTKEAFPVLRYRTGDLASLTREPCRCGRTHARMSRIKGRLDDMLIIRGVNVFPSELERVVMEEAALSPHYQIVLTRQDGMDRVTLKVEVSSDWLHQQGEAFDSEADNTRLLQNQTRERLYATLGIRTEVMLQPPRTLPRSEGKAVRVVDQRQ
jgi:phenylacetate-CoA ligase